MGTISRKLEARFQKALDVAGEKVRRQWRKTVLDVWNIQRLVGQGHDPLHAAYLSTQKFLVLFSETVSAFEEFDDYCEIVGFGEERYRPDGPPTSPLTVTYFTTWSLLDTRLGRDEETIGTCLFHLADFLKLDPPRIETLKEFQASRMGIYERTGESGPIIHLRELITGEEFPCYPTSGYRGKAGEIWYVRLCPPISVLEQVPDYHIPFTTPYVLTNASKTDWTAYLKKNLSSTRESEQGPYEFLKYGPTTFHWHEFIFQAYHHAQYDAIFLAGLPDVTGSLPHGDMA